jgi:hypothetical protein
MKICRDGINYFRGDSQKNERPCVHDDTTNIKAAFRNDVNAP